MGESSFAEERPFAWNRVESIDGRLVVVERRKILQSELTSDCWAIQFRGLKACEECEFLHTEECGGGETLRRMESENG